MKRALILVACLAAPTFVSAEASEEVVAKIEAMLTEMECQMDTDDIEVEDDGYELDDVICKGEGQFDIMLDNDLNIVEKRAE